MHVVGNIEVRIIGSVRAFCVGAPVEDAELAAEVLKFRLPGIFPVVLAIYFIFKNFLNVPIDFGMFSI